MSDDAKMDFYLEHRALIEEWALLRAPAAAALDEALMAASMALGDDEDLPAPKASDGTQERTVKLMAITEPFHCWLELNWKPRSLLSGTGRWPVVCVVANPKHPKEDRDNIRSAVAGARSELRFESSANQWWLRAATLTPSSEPIDIDAYAASCAESFRQAWVDLHKVIATAVRSTSS